MARLSGSKKATDDNARWGKSFRNSRSQLERLAREALAEHQAHKTKALMPMRVARKAGQKADVFEPRAISAKYDARSKQLVINLRSGATFLLPIRLIEGLESAKSKDISAVEILGNGSALHWEALDIDLSVPHLLMGIFGTKAWMSHILSQSGRSAKPIRNLSKAGISAELLTGEHEHADLHAKKSSPKRKLL